MEYEVWDFPSLISDTLNNQQLAEERIKDEANEASILVQQLQHAELIQQQQILQNKIALVKSLHVELKKTVEKFDEELLQKVVSCTKNIAKKIICKEIAEDPSILQAMLTEAAAQIKLTKECIILVSADDAAALTSEDMANMPAVFQVSTELARGDFKIITPTGEIVAILENRLNAHFGLST